MMAALGMFVFELSSLPFQELQRRRDWRHAGNPRVGFLDDFQFTGPGGDKIALTGTAHAELMDGVASLETLARMAADGEAYPFVDGTGIVWGNVVIESVDQRHSVFFPDGTPRAISFGVELTVVDTSHAGERAA